MCYNGCQWGLNVAGSDCTATTDWQGQMKQMSRHGRCPLGAPDGGALRLMRHAHSKRIRLCKDTT